MLNVWTRTLLSAASRAVARAPSTVAPLARSFSQLSLAPVRPGPSSNAPGSLYLPVSIAQQTRTFKMPSCMKKKSSPVARNSGAGKTARKHSARRAKRRRQRAKKIN
ncbi:hypothetical protein JCM3766R1_001498 [Sporobolomyces carnicolor]